MRISILLFIITNILSSQTINEQIHALEKASPQERVKLMNNIKRELISMNEEKRMSTISSLREKLQARHEETTHEMALQENSNQERFSHRERGSHLEEFAQQEHMTNSTHIKEIEHHQFMQNRAEQQNRVEQQNHVEQQIPERESGQHEIIENNYHNSER